MRACCWLQLLNVLQVKNPKPIITGFKSGLFRIFVATTFKNEVTVLYASLQSANACTLCERNGIQFLFFLSKSTVHRSETYFHRDWGFIAILSENFSPLFALVASSALAGYAWNCLWEIIFSSSFDIMLLHLKLTSL